MAKRFTAALSAAVMLLSLAACADGSQKDDSEKDGKTADAQTSAQADVSADASDNTASEKSAKDILEQLRKDISEENLDGSAYFGEDVFENNCRKLYGMDIEEFSDGGILYNDGGGMADEISLIRSGSGNADKFSQALEERKQMRLDLFQGYAPEEVYKIENALIFTKGDWAALIISDDADSIEEYLKNAL